MFKFNKFLHIALIAILSLVHATTQANNKEEIKGRINQALEKLQAILEENTPDVLKLKAIHEQQQVIEALLESERTDTIEPVKSFNNTDTENLDKEAHFFEPKKPKKLSDEIKKKPVIDRIKERFIGDIPPEIVTAISYFEHHQEYLDNNVEITNGVLLPGEPGTGKTFLFKVMTEELEIPSLHFSASFFADKYIGEASRKIRRAFEVAKNSKGPFIIFIDEIDAIGTKRKDSTHDEQRGTLITLLTEIQELSTNKNVLIMVATNDIEALDPAVTDRFPATCHIERLNREQRKAFILKLFKDKNLLSPDSVELANRLAEATEKYQCGYLSDAEKHVDPKRQKMSLKDCSYSNRDIEYIVTTGKARQFTDCTINKKDCDKKLCAYFADVMNKMGNIGKDAQGRRIINCDNLK